LSSEPVAVAAKAAVGIFVAAIVFTVVAISLHLNALFAAITVGVLLFVSLLTIGFHERKRRIRDVESDDKG
jgi:uncharacterized protein YqfA (UPF0365 family)